MNGSVFPGINADGLKTIGRVVLRGATSTGEVRMNRAKLGGVLNLEAVDSTLDLRARTGKAQLFLPTVLKRRGSSCAGRNSAAKYSLEEPS